MLYVPDDSVVAVVRDITFYIEIGGGTGEVGVYAGSGLDVSDPVFIYKEQTAVDTQLYQWHGHQTLRLGDTLWFWTDVDHANVRVSGYELTR